MRKVRRKGDHWQFHFNDWMDNGTYHRYEEMEDAIVPEPKDEGRDSQEEEYTKDARSNPKKKVPVRAVQSTKNSLRNTGRFDQFNEEFDGNFNMHSEDAGYNVKDAETPAKGTIPDEYEDEDPYKIVKPGA